MPAKPKSPARTVIPLDPSLGNGEIGVLVDTGTGLNLKEHRNHLRPAGAQVQAAKRCEVCGRGRFRTHGRQAAAQGIVGA
jgi:ribosomal protein S14